MKACVICTLLILNIGLLKAQQKKVSVVKIATPEALCNDCKQRIELYLKYEDGVAKVVVYPNLKYTMVTFLNDRTDIEIIKTAIANCGYDADDITADSSAYAKLPATCKKLIDGGHKRKYYLN
ncbi:MAG: heavy-metal-associated domain-containing protein [Chitinophagaceae bacterium]